MCLWSSLGFVADFSALSQDRISERFFVETLKSPLCFLRHDFEVPRFFVRSEIWDNVLMCNSLSPSVVRRWRRGSSFGARTFTRSAFVCACGAGRVEQVRDVLVFSVPQGVVFDVVPLISTMVLRF